MSANPEVEKIVSLPVETNGHHVELAPEVEPATEPVATPAPQAKTRRARPPWAATAALGAVALIATGTLGYVAHAAAEQRDGLYARLVTTTVTLASTQDQLTAAQSDARSKKVTADYVAMYVADGGRVQTDYEVLNDCSSFSTCRTGSQQLLADLQKFQADRTAAVVPSALSASDSSLGDALSAAIAADAEIISGMDSGNVDKFKDGFDKLQAAMLNVAKAEAALGAELK
jgi:hypothetical protein